MARFTTCIQFYCRKSTANKQGLSPVQASVIINGERIIVNTPRKERPEVFKKALESRKANDIREFVEVYRNNINAAITDIMAHGEPLTVAALRDYMKNGGYKTYRVHDLFQEYYTIHTDWKDEHRQKYNVVENLFMEYTNNAEVTSLKPATIQKFYNEINKTKKTSTTAGMMTKLHSVLTFAYQNRYINIDLFQGIKIAKGDPKIEYLTEKQLQILINKDIDNNRLRSIRDLAIIQASTGLSYIDLCDLKEENILERDGTYYIVGNRHKTGVAYTAVILPEGMEIIRKRGIPRVPSNQKMNSYLKEIETICNLDIHLHSHLLRKTYCTRLLNYGVRIETVAKCAGHSSSKITERLYAHMQKDTILDEVTKAFR